MADFRFNYLGEKVTEPSTGHSYPDPNLLTRHYFYNFSCFLGPEHFVEGGYQLVEEDKTSTFFWQQIPTDQVQLPL